MAVTDLPPNTPAMRHHTPPSKYPQSTVRSAPVKRQIGWPWAVGRGERRQQEIVRANDAIPHIEDSSV